MEMDEIKPGMVFKDNDKRAGVPKGNGRWLKVNRVEKSQIFNEGIVFSSFSYFGPYGPWSENKQVVARSHRFYREKKGQGYSLVQDVLV